MPLPPLFTTFQTHWPFCSLNLKLLLALKPFARAVCSSGNALLPQHKDGSFLSFIFYLKCHLFRNTTDLHTGYHLISDISPISLFTYFLPLPSPQVCSDFWPRDFSSTLPNCCLLTSISHFCHFSVLKDFTS